MVDRYLEGLAAGKIAAGVEVVPCPPTPYLAPMAAGLEGLGGVELGAQDCSAVEADGAFTGDVSAAMLADLGCRWVIVGHSERRRGRGESDETVAAKFVAAESAGLTPILCVGETEAERQEGRAREIVLAQVDAIIACAGADCFTRAVVAYEPVWAIGTGKAATPAIACEMHGFVRQAVARHDREAGAALRVLYGGSVKPENAAAFFAESDIDGALVGGAALASESLLAIVAAAAAQ